jgi:hypothetical protein
MNLSPAEVSTQALSRLGSGQTFQERLTPFVKETKEDFRQLYLSLSKS